MSDIFLAYDASEVLFFFFILFKISISLLSIRGTFIVSYNANTCKGTLLQIFSIADPSNVRDITIPCIRLKATLKQLITTHLCATVGVFLLKSTLCLLTGNRGKSHTHLPSHVDTRNSQDGHDARKAQPQRLCEPE